MPIPALIAGGALLAGAVGDYLTNRENAKNAEDMYNDLVGKVDSTVAANQNDINAYQDFIQKQYGADAGKYSQALADYMATPVYQNEGFSYRGDVADYMDPAANQRVAAAMNAINNSAASGGSRFSSDYVNRVAGKQQALASEEWRNAYDRLVQDRQQQLAAYNANANNSWNNYNAQTAKQQYGIGQYGQAQNNLAQGYGDALSAGISNRTAGLQSQANATAGMVSAQNQGNQSFLGQIAGPAAQFLGAYYGKGV